MGALEQLVEKMFCSELRTMLVDHLTKCSQCRAGVAAMVDQLPMLSMFLPSELKTKLKDWKNGNCT
jgi:predicted anti-sigma-YlaC factor YlaD